MSDYKSILGMAAGVMAIIQVIPYLVSILRGHTKPSRTSYGIWLVVQIITLAGYLAAGASTTKWMPIAVAINGVIIFLLSFKYGMGGFNKLDIICLLLAGLAIILWVMTDDPDLAVYASMLAWLIGYIPTFKKSYLQPQTENTLSWGLYTVSALLNVFALTTLTPVIIIPPLMALFATGTVTILLLLPKRFRR